MKNMIQKGKRSKTLSEVKLFEKTLKSFLEISHVQRDILPSYKLQDHEYYKNTFGLKEYNPSHREIARIQVCLTQGKNFRRV